MLIARQPPASTHIVACVERMFFTSRSQPRIIIPHAARCCKPFFSILPIFFEKIWRMPPLTADFPPGGCLLFKTCRIISFSGGRTVFFSAFSSRGVSYHIVSQKKSPAGRFFPAGLCLIPFLRWLQSAAVGRQPKSFAVQAGSLLWYQPVAFLIHRVVPSQATPGCSQGITSLPVPSSSPQLSP